MGEDNKSNFAKERAKQKAQQRLSQISGGDLTRGFGGPSKSNVSETISTVRRRKTAEETDVKQTNTTAKSQQTKSQTITKDTTTKAKTQTTKKSGSIDEVITVNASRGKERRKKVIISMLSAAIAVVWGFIIIASVIKPAQPHHNFKVYLSGAEKSQATVLLNGKAKTEWGIKDGLAVGTSYEDNITLKLTCEDPVLITFRVEVYKNDYLIKNFGTIDTDEGFSRRFNQDNKEFYVGVYRAPIEVTILSKISIVYSSSDPAMEGLNSKNVRIKLYIQVD